MAVKFTKPEINVREKLAELDKPSGIAGEALLRADSVQEQRDLIGAGRRNAIINGGFDVWQRGTSVTTNGFDEYTVDRFMGYGKTSSWGGSYVATTFSRQAFAAGQTEVPGNPKYYARLTGTSTGRKNTFSTYLEDVTTFSGQIVTLSFYARSSTPVFLDTQVQQSFGSVNTVDFDPNITTTDTWTRYVRVFKMPSLAGETISSDSKLIVYLLRYDDVPSGTTLDFANAQLELGSVATEFDNSLRYEEQLALCQRFYYTTGYQKRHAAIGSGLYWHESLMFPVQMRANPTCTWTTNTGSNFTIHGFETTNTGSDYNGNGVRIDFRSNSTSTSAYLYGTMTANAEL